MSKGKKARYDMAVLALFVVLLAAVLITPSVTGFVNINDPDPSDDLKMRVLMENALVRMQRQGKIELSEELSREDLKENFKDFFGEVPTPIKEGYFYNVDPITGKVSLSNEKLEGKISF